MECLVEKLKVEVNNPDLPIFEPMLQFTLDAIQASGNNQMTNAQKSALNHFFYQIEVEKNDGIFSKISSLYMPLICNQSLSYALYDYKRNINDSSYLRNSGFSGNGLIHSGDASYGSFLRGAISAMTNNFHYAVGIMYPASNNRLLATQDSVFTELILSGSDYMVPKFQNTGMPNLISKTKYINNLVFNVGNQSVKAVTDCEGTIYDSEYTFGSDVVVNRITYYFDSTPQSIMIHGNSLTDTEQTTLASAIRELIINYQA